MNLYFIDTNEEVALPQGLMDSRGEEEWYVLNVEYPSGGGSSGKVRASKPGEVPTRLLYPGVFGCYIADAPRENGAPVVTETDCAFLLRCLSDGRPHTLNELLQRSFTERGCGLTVHSRAADLRKQGYRITNRPGTRKRVSIYQLEPTPEEVFGPGTVRRIERDAAA